MMNEAWIIDAARTPRGIGKLGRGALVDIHPQRLMATVLRALADRNDVNKDEIDDVIVSCSAQIGKQARCIARMSALAADFPDTASGITVQRFCGGGISAVNLAAANVMAGMEDLLFAGGVEMMSYSRSVDKSVGDAGNLELRAKHPLYSVGVAADIIASEEGISREELDQYSVASQERAAQAINNGWFDNSLVPVHHPNGDLALDREEYPRPGTTLEVLAELKPAFIDSMDQPFHDSGVTYGEMVAKVFPGLKVEHRHHAGSSSGVVDGAGGVIVASSEYAKSRGLKPRAKIRALANIGHSPEYILNAPVDCTKKLLKKAGMTTDDIDLFEVNEAFAVVPMKFMRDLNVDHDKVNVNGGAIALGHPIGATGAMLIGTVLDELERRDQNIGLVTMCAAGGMAPGVIVERI